MMKIFITMLCLFIFITSIAQQKHSIAFGIDYLEHSYPSKWYKKKIHRSNYVYQRKYFDISTNLGIWADYFYKNRYSLRFYTAELSQNAEYRDVRKTPYYFLSNRHARFWDVLIGYNVLSLVNTDRFNNKVSFWTFIGVGYMSKFSNRLYSAYDPTRWDWDNNEAGSLVTIDWINYDHKIKPSVQMQLTYRPVHYILLGIGGTYHHVGKDFKPVSGNISLGLQI